MDLSRFDARDLGFATDAVKPFEDLTAYELARRVRVERALAMGDALASLIAALTLLPARLLGFPRRPTAEPVRARTARSM
jgi:hypothetical protein